MNKLPRSHNPKLSEEQRTEICERYKAGEPATELSDAFDVSIAAVCAILKRRGIPRNHHQSKLRQQALEYREWWRENAPVSFGFCWCGCGEKTNLAPYSKKSPRRVQGQPLLFIHGHAALKPINEAHKIEDRGYETPCWIWQRATTITGYGVIFRSGQNALAHRFVYQLAKGSISDSLLLHHLCEQKACVNPDHLMPVSGAEHIHVHERVGENVHCARLTEEQVREIRSLRRAHNLPFRTLGKMFNVNATTVERIVNFKTWKHVSG